MWAGGWGGEHLPPIYFNIVPPFKVILKLRVCVWVSACEYSHLGRPEEGVGSRGVGVMGSCERPEAGAEH